MSLGMLQVAIERCFATGTPTRQLRIECNVRNPNPQPVCIVDVWINVTTQQGVTLAEGRFYLRKPQMYGEIPVGQNEDEMGEIVVPLNDGVLRHIEGVRAGRD